MKLVLTLSESAELELIKNVLEEGDIHCVIRNQEFAQAIPALPFNAELWVMNDDQLPQAHALCQDWFAPDPDAQDVWECRECGQKLGSRFDSCWKCGTKRERLEKPANSG